MDRVTYDIAPRPPGGDRVGAAGPWMHMPSQRWTEARATVARALVRARGIDSVGTTTGTSKPLRSTTCHGSPWYFRFSHCPASGLRALQSSRADFYELSNPGTPHTFELPILSGLPQEAASIAPQPYRIAIAIHSYAAERGGEPPGKC
jgi:hypothetical protein